MGDPSPHKHFSTDNNIITDPPGKSSISANFSWNIFAAEMGRLRRRRKASGGPVQNVGFSLKMSYKF